jgi:benzoyl-CoA reductase/2-hydroxyglutaryl-CoA dehydratase subunit BcrC/BadD/HgdB
MNSILTAWEISNTSQIVRAEQDAIKLSCKSPDADTVGKKAITSSLAAIESQMQQLKDLIKENFGKQEEIIALRDGVRIITPCPKFMTVISFCSNCIDKSVSAYGFV